MQSNEHSDWASAALRAFLLRVAKAICDEAEMAAERIREASR